MPPTTPTRAMRMNPMRSSVRPRWRGVSRYLGIRAGIGVVVTSVTRYEPRPRLMTGYRVPPPLPLNGPRARAPVAQLDRARAF